jgi:SAM-dependent methyltransferase
MMCHRYFRDRGHTGISFTGLDIAPLAPGSSKGHASNDLAKPDRDMRWRFVQHDMRLMPFPFADDEFDLVMIKDMSLATTNSMQQRLMDEYLRILRPGGCLEIWESDHTVRMLRPHVPDTASAGDDDDLREDAAALLGAYVMSANTPLSGPLNNFLMEYNGWLARALESRDLSPVPCTLIGPMLLQESDALTDVRSRRLAVPLGEVRWEKEGIGGVVTKDGKSFIDTKGKGKGLSPGKGSSPSKGSHSTKDSNFSKGGKGAPKGGKDQERKLTAAQAALRRTALLTIVQHVQSLESVLREVSGKSQDEWDGWIGKMMGDLVRDGGTSWGECLEVGAWWARKKS